MVRVVKSILSLLLIAVFYVVANNCIVKEENLCDDFADVSFSSPEYFLDNIQLPYLPEAELGSVGTYIQHSAFSRISRVYFSSFVFSLRDIVIIMAERKAILIKHLQKARDRYVLSSITHPIGEYYVFALRRIII